MATKTKRETPEEADVRAYGCELPRELSDLLAAIEANDRPDMRAWFIHTIAKTPTGNAFVQLMRNDGAREVVVRISHTRGRLLSWEVLSPIEHDAGGDSSTVSASDTLAALRKYTGVNS